MKERGFAILLHYARQPFTSYSCDDSCKEESFASLEATGKETPAQSPGRSSRSAEIIARGFFERREAWQARRRTG